MTTPIDSSGTSLQRVYQNPPVVEALCEVHFASGNWDESIPERLYQEIKDDFPKRQMREFREANVTVSEDDDPTTEVRKLPSWFMFFTESQDQLIQVSETIFVFNQLTPYRPFLEWKDNLVDAYSKYRELAPPQRANRIDVRYINRIEIPATQFSTDDYFTIAPVIPADSGNRLGPFLIQYALPQPGENHLLIITFRTLEADESSENHQQFLFDLHDQMQIDKEVNEIDLEAHVEAVHEVVTKAFEGSITDNLRRLFEPGGPA